MKRKQFAIFARLNRIRGTTDHDFPYDSHILCLIEYNDAYYINLHYTLHLHRNASKEHEDHKPCHLLI